MVQTASPDAAILTSPRPIDPGIKALADCVRRASRRRGLTAGEWADDLADSRAVGVIAARGPMAAQPFLEALVAPLLGGAPEVLVDCDPDLRLPVRELAAIGTIASEAITNAIAHGFPGGRAGRIWVRLHPDEGRIRLTVRDNGVGMPDLDPDPMTGRGLVDALTRELGGFSRMGSAPFGGALVTLVYTSA